MKSASLSLNALTLRTHLLYGLAIGLGGCSGAPVVPVAGSFFPAWLLCALVGCAAALLAYAVFARLSVLPHMPVPLLACLAVGYLVGGSVWLLWVGN